MSWCGRAVQAGPAVLFDFENPAWAIRKNFEDICLRHRVPFPRIPEDLEIFAEFDNQSINPATATLFDLLKNGSAAQKFDLLEAILIGMAFVAPNLSALVSKRGGQQHAGSSLAIQNAANSLGQSVGPLLGGVLFIWQINAPYLLVSLGKLW